MLRKDNITEQAIIKPFNRSVNPKLKSSPRGFIYYMLYLVIYTQSHLSRVSYL